MRRFGLGLALAAGLALGLAADVAAGADTWQVRIEQEGKTLAFSREVHLKKAPFVFIFEGPRSYAYAVTASVTKADLENLRTPDQIDAVIRGTNLMGEADDGSDRTLGVNNTGAIRAEDNVAQQWYNDAEDMKHSFQSVVLKGDTATSRRQIEDVMLYTNFRTNEEMKIRDLKIREVHVLITGLPPVGRMAHVEPKFASLVFDR